MVHYVKLVIYRESLCLYYSSGNGNCFRLHFGIRISNFNEKIKTKIKNSLKKNLIPDEFLPFQEEIKDVFEFTNKEISKYKLNKGRKPTIEELKEILNNRIETNGEGEKTTFLDYYYEFLVELV
jgi:hypothetical protein